MLCHRRHDIPAGPFQMRIQDWVQEDWSSHFCELKTHQADCWVFLPRYWDKKLRKQLKTRLDVFWPHRLFYSNAFTIFCPLRILPLWLSIIPAYPCLVSNLEKKVSKRSHTQKEKWISKFFKFLCRFSSSKTSWNWEFMTPMTDLVSWTRSCGTIETFQNEKWHESPHVSTLQQNLVHETQSGVRVRNSWFEELCLQDLHLWQSAVFSRWWTPWEPSHPAHPPQQVGLLESRNQTIKIQAPKTESWIFICHCQSFSLRLAAENSTEAQNETKCQGIHTF